MLMKQAKAFCSWLTDKTLRQLPLLLFVIFVFSAPSFINTARLPLAGLITYTLPQSVIFGVVFALLANLRKWIWWTIYSLCSLIMLLEFGAFFTQSSRITSSLAIIIAQSNVGESSEFLSAFYKPVLTSLAIAVAIAFAVIIFDKLWQKRWFKSINESINARAYLVYTLAFCILASSAFSVLRIKQSSEVHTHIWQRTTNGQVADFSVPIVYFYVAKDLFFNPIEEKLVGLAAIQHNIIINDSGPADSIMIVYVVGESSDRNRSNIYGYPMETNPRLAQLQKNGSMAVFKNVVSRYHQTIDLYAQLLSPCDIEDKESFYKLPMLPAIFKKIGYDVAYYDNQSSPEEGRLFDIGCQFFFTNKTVKEQNLNRLNSHIYSYDGDIFENHPPKEYSLKNLIIYHLIGNHMIYSERYPHEYAVFKAEDYAPLYSGEAAEKMAHYDNATHYTDSLLNKLINKLSTKNAVLVYTSDHGDEVYDYRDSWGRSQGEHPVGSDKVLHEVPLYVWASEKFRAKHPGVMDSLRANADKPIYNTDISHTILELAGIKTPYLNKNLSLLHKSAGRRNRRTTTFDYDRRRAEIDSVRLRYDGAGHWR